MDKIAKIDKRWLENRIDDIVSRGERSIVVYPFGEIGRYAAEYLLKLHGIKIIYGIDNNLADGKDIFSLDEIKPESDKVLYLICSSNPDCYEEIRHRLYEKLTGIRSEDIFAHDITSPWYKSYLNFRMRDAIYNATYDVNERLHKAKYLSCFWNNKYIHVSNDDLIVGNAGIGTLYPFAVYGIGNNNDIRALRYQGSYIENEEEEYINAVEMGLICRNPGVHTTPAYTDIVQNGIAKRREYVEKMLCKSPDNLFYLSEREVLTGFRRLIIRYADEAEKRYELSGRIYDNLIEISKNCRNIADNAPETFNQALQLIFFVHMGIVMENGCGSFSFGRIDQYLYPFYKQDIDNGRINNEEARNYLYAFWKKLSEMDKGWQNVTVGGGRNGSDECNELTIMCINAAKEIHGQQPQLSLRVSRTMPDEVWEDAMDLISCGMGFPSLFNDEICKKALESKGMTKEDAENYSVMGCVELLTEGKEFSHQEGMRFNFVKFLEILLHGGRCGLTNKKWHLVETRDIDEMRDFEQFIDWFKDELSDTLIRLCTMLDITSAEYGKRYHAPFLSAMMEGPLENGRDVHDNGTIYNNITICGVGAGEIADCLEAIKKICFEERKLKPSELVDILDEDFEGHEDIREKLQKYDKYGNDCDDVDGLCRDIVKLFTDTITGFTPKYRDGSAQVGFYTSYFHADFGRLTAASPDGRHKGMPLSPSLSPMAGMDKNGVLSVINSVNKIEMDYFGNNMALDIKFAPTFFDKYENKSALEDLITAYFQNGGAEIQINVVDAETLKKAKNAPLKYRNVIVRVAGFSARFVDLDDKLQDEIIRRTENSIV